MINKAAAMAGDDNENSKNNEDYYTNWSTSDEDDFSLVGRLGSLSGHQEAMVLKLYVTKGDRKDDILFCWLALTSLLEED